MARLSDKDCPETGCLLVEEAPLRSPALCPSCTRNCEEEIFKQTKSLEERILVLEAFWKSQGIRDGQ